MIVLGIDPGYRNLGMSIMRVSSGQAELLWSGTKSVGSQNRGMDFPKLLWPILEKLDMEYSIEAVAAESAPFIQRQIKTTALLWAVTTIISSWAFNKGIPFKHAAPITIKKATSRAMGEKFTQKFMPKKKDIKSVVYQYCGTTGKTNHEDDAALSTILLYTDLIPNA